MNKTLIRFTGGFVVLLGLAYLGHKVVVRTPETAPAPVKAEAAQQAAAAAPAAAPAAAAPAVVNANAYAVYPDRQTDTDLGLTYSSFSGDFVKNVVVTPLPPHVAGRTVLRIKGQQSSGLSVVLNDPRCASPVHVVVSRIDQKQPMETQALSAANPKFTMQFDKQWLPHLLVETRMDDKAQNNYFCGVTVSWNT